MSRSEYLIWLLPMYFYVLAPKFLVPGIGEVDSGIVGLVMLILLSWTGRLGFMLSSFLGVALTFLLLYIIMIISSLVNQEFGPYVHHYYFFVVPIYLLLGISLGTYWQFKLSFGPFCESLLKMALVVGAFNSIVIILSFRFPIFRMFLEGLLYQNPESNINYSTRAFRLRGLASGGGANQSFFLGSMVVVSFGLFLYKRISLRYAASAAAVAVMALAVVGRTGFVVAILGVSTLVIGFLWKNILNLTVSKKILLSAMLVVGSVFLLPNLFSHFFSDSIFRYSLGFFYDGVTGIRNEGTVDVLAGSYHLPHSVLSLLIGVGNGSGAFISGLSTDPGYMKMFTAVGILGALVFYGSLFYALIRLARISGMQLLVVSLGLVWFLAEFKEPLMLKGYFSRVLWMLIGVMIAYRHCYRNLNIYQSRNPGISPPPPPVYNRGDN